MPFLADACFFDDITEAGKIVRIDERGVESLELAGPAPQPQAEVLRTGKAMILPDPAGKGGVRHELQAQIMSQSGFQSMIVVPLIVRGETLGALTLAVRGKKRRYGPKDLVLAEELARRAAIAIDHARLHRQTERAVRARENILNIVSHDLRGPLNALTLSASLLIEELTAAGGTATTHQALELLQRSVKRMDRMVGDLLDTASIDSGQLAITKDDHVLQAIVTEAVEGGMSAAARKSLRLEARLPQAKIRVTCDRGRIVQVLSNLISNAIKFTAPGGSIVVSVEPSETELRVAVRDTGIGIDRTHLPFVFDPYFRSRETVTTGTGLGLYISKGIIQSHGGALWVESAPGQGSTFTFSLPR
jgi:signal transduction histidine kinase